MQVAVMHRFSGAAGLHKPRHLTKGSSSTSKSRAPPLAPAPRSAVIAAARSKRGDDAAPDQHQSAGDAAFEADTTAVVVRCLTARAAQKVLLSLEAVDTFQSAWLRDFCAAHPPLDGDKFIQDLMATAPVTALDPYTGRAHAIAPARLAAGVLAVRDELAKGVAKALPGAVAARNVAVLRRHLEEHTYVSGTHAGAPRASYREYRAAPAGGGGGAGADGSDGGGGGRGGRWRRLAGR